MVNAAKLYKEHLSLLKDNSTLARVHLRSRVINNIVFQFADNKSAVVIDTTDKSEDILKMYEESFRGHVAPIIALYKSELLDIADLFGITEIRKTKSGCPELLDFNAYGMEWDELDPILHLITTEKEPIKEIAKKHELDLNWLKSLEKRITQQKIRTVVQKTLV